MRGKANNQAGLEPPALGLTRSHLVLQKSVQRLGLQSTRKLPMLCPMEGGEDQAERGPLLYISCIIDVFFPTKF